MGRLLLRALLRALPADFRSEFGRSLRQTLEDEDRNAGRGGSLLGRLVHRARSLADVLLLALRLRRDRVRGASASRPTLPVQESPTMANLFQDVRYAARSLVRTPTLTLLALLTLALGFGANATIFSLVDGVLLRSLPYPSADELVTVWESNPPRGWEYFSVSAPNYFDWKQQTRSYRSMTGYYGITVTLTGVGDPERITGARVAGDYFATLGVEPEFGRSFTPEELHGGPAAVVLSHEFWQGRLGGSADTLGSTLELDGVPCTVVGILGTDQAPFPAWARLWRPMDLNQEAESARGAHYWQVIARLADGVDLARAEAEITALAARLPLGAKGWTARVESLHEDIVGDTRPALTLLQVAVLLVLLIACANVANLLLARTTRRIPELAVRSALGASRMRLMRLVLIESLLLALAGAAGGALLAVGGLGLVRSLASDTVPRIDQVHIDATTLGVTFLLATFTGLAFGLIPSLRPLRSAPADALRPSGRSVAGGGRLRAGMVVAEVALAVVVVSGAALLGKSLWKLQAVDPGFATAGRMSFRVSLPSAAYPDGSLQRGFYDTLLSRVRSLPGVLAAGATTALPMQGDLNVAFDIDGRPQADPADRPSAELRAVDPGYFEVMGIPLRRGRGFTAEDVAGSEPVTVVNAALAARFFAGDDPLGATIEAGFDQPVAAGEEGRVHHRVIGVVGDVSAVGLARDPVPVYYVSREQHPSRSMTVVVREAHPEGNLLPELRGAVAEVDPTLPLYQVRTLDDVLAADTGPERFRLTLVASFASLALALAAVGIYGTLSQLVVQRRREMGIRLAVGAAPRQLLAQIFGHGLRIAAAGLVLGLAGAVGAGVWMASMLYGISSNDPAALVSVAGILFLVVVLACWVPARRATRVDPVSSLRAE